MENPHAFRGYRAADASVPCEWTEVATLYQQSVAPLAVSDMSAQLPQGSALLPGEAGERSS